MILFEMAIQDLCFKKSFITCSPFLPQASLNNWNKKWIWILLSHFFLFVISLRSMAEPWWRLGVRPLKHFSIFFDLEGK